MLIYTYIKIDLEGTIAKLNNGSVSKRTRDRGRTKGVGDFKSALGYHL